MGWKANLPARRRVGVSVSARRLPRGNVYTSVAVGVELIAELGWPVRARFAVLEGEGDQAGKLRLELAGEAQGAHVRTLTKPGVRDTRSEIQFGVVWPGYTRPFGKTPAAHAIEDGGLVITMPDLPPEPAPGAAAPKPERRKPQLVADQRADAELQAAALAAAIERGMQDSPPAMLEPALPRQWADGEPVNRPPSGDAEARLRAVAAGLTGSAHRYLIAFIREPVQTTDSLRALHDGPVAESSVTAYMTHVRRALVGTGWKIEAARDVYTLSEGEQAYGARGPRPKGAPEGPRGFQDKAAKQAATRPSRAGEDRKPVADAPVPLRPAKTPVVPGTAPTWCRRTAP